jgi:chromosome segregation protein
MPVHLKRLDILGFKSFPDRTRLSFGPGLTAVVGPNGSGKSNIADALRWVMGETSAKTLRGGKMEDVIFSGTAHRRALGFAEIVMQVDNSDRTLSLDTNEVTVTRRVFRSGESEYLLNGAVCRLKDIQMLFMDTGVGRDGYSVIGQGRIDEILSARSEDRRSLFEEAAGIGKFKARRNEALHKMEREQQNLARVTDIITELSEQLEPLSTQSEEARLYLSLREQYKDVHINIFLSEALRLQDEISKTDELLNDLTLQSKGGQMILTEARSAGEALKTSAAAAHAAYKSAGERLIELSAEIEKKESDIRLLLSERHNALENRNRFQEAIDKHSASIAEKMEQAEQEASAEYETGTALRALQEKLAERQDDFSALDETMRAREEELGSHDRAVMERISLAAEAKAKIREAENLYERLEEDKERLNSEILHNDTLLAEENGQQQILKNKIAAHEAGMAKQQAQLDAYRQAQSQLIITCKALAAEYETVFTGLQTNASRYAALKQLEEHHEGYRHSVKAVLRGRNSAYTGICGAVGELIGISPEYERAIEIALGNAAQHIVVRTEADAKHAITLLKTNNEGRATFLPLNAVKGHVMDISKLKNEIGLVGVASELIEYNSTYAGVMAQLLGNVLIMDGMDDALSFHKKYKYAHKIVTLEGELLSPGGAITGGSFRQSASGILGRGRQLAELKTQLEDLRKKTDELLTKKKSEDEKLTSTNEAVNRASERVQALLLEQGKTENSLAQSAERLLALETAAQNYQRENENLMARLVETNGLVRAFKIAWADSEEAVQEARRQMELYRMQMASERALQSEQVRELTDLRVEIGRRTEMLNQINANIARIHKERDILSAEIEAWKTEISASEKSERERETALDTAREAVLQTKAYLAEQRLAVTAMEKEQQELTEAMGQAEADERTQADETTRLEREIARLEMRREQLEADSRRLYDEIWEEYSLTYQQALSYKKPMAAAFLRRESQRLKAELALLTNVNVGAIDMYKQIKTRHDFLSAQRTDIEKAEADLRQLINTLTQQMEERFADQFDKISSHFNDVFREMFNGGQAGLKLLNKNNLLESGIEISAQPPGKSLQTLSLLSGGEKALTAIALLFAILRLKPSPFCVLDEIEANLDDANVQRFARFLQQYAADTQFIIITHRKGTMEAADTLYGVTMQEQGVSKLVSVRFTESEVS